MVSAWEFNTMMVRVLDPVLCREVLKDTDTYMHTFLNVVKYSDRFLGKNHLVAVNDFHWKRQRKILDPAFKSIGNYFKIFSTKTAEVIHQMIKKNRVVDSVHKFTQAMALDILGLAIFGYDFKSISLDDNQNLHSYVYLTDLFSNIKKALPALITHNFDSLESTKETIKQIEIWEKLRSSLITESKKRIQEKIIDSSSFSMLDMMVESLMEHDEDERMTEQEIADNIGIFFLAGHETTASALAFGVQVIAKYPEIQSKLRKEMIETIEHIDPQSIENLPYLTMFIKEVLRMYPPIAATPPKVTSKDTYLGDYFIPKGSYVSVSVIDVHMNEEIYENPEEFRPERWEKNAKKKIPHYAWIPFSSGPRICIGNNFSMMEQKIFFTELLMKYEITLVDPSVSIEVSSNSSILQSPKSVSVKFSKLCNILEDSKRSVIIYIHYAYEKKSIQINSIFLIENSMNNYSDDLKCVVVDYTFESQGKNRIGMSFPEMETFKDFHGAFNFIANQPHKRKKKFIEISTLLCVLESGMLSHEKIIFFRLMLTMKMKMRTFV
eukprot:gene6141-10149_t